jgi:hypothetical protein
MGSAGQGRWVELGGGRLGPGNRSRDAGYLQQSFLRMKIAFSNRRKNPPIEEALIEEALMDTGHDIIGDGTDGGEFLRIFIGYFDAEFFFEGHKSFENVEGIQAQVIGKGGIGDQGGFFYPELFVKDAPHFGHNLRFIDSSVHNQ